MLLKLTKPKAVQTIAPAKIDRPAYVHKPAKEITIDLPAGKGVVQIETTDEQLNHLYKVWDLRKGTPMVLVEVAALKALLSDYSKLIGVHGARVAYPRLKNET